MEIRNVILTQLQLAVEKYTEFPFPDEIDDGTPLDNFWLDSIAFTSLFVSIESEIGFMPTAILSGEAFPDTIGEFIEIYEREMIA